MHIKCPHIQIYGPPVVDFPWRPSGEQWLSNGDVPFTMDPNGRSHLYEDILSLIVIITSTAIITSFIYSVLLHFIYSALLHFIYSALLFAGAGFKLSKLGLGFSIYESDKSGKEKQFGGHKSGRSNFFLCKSGTRGSRGKCPLMREEEDGWRQSRRKAEGTAEGPSKLGFIHQECVITVSPTLIPSLVIESLHCTG